MKIKRMLVILGIAFIFALFVGYGIEVFDSSPKYEDFCSRDLFDIKNESECLAQGGEWREDLGVPKSVDGAGFCGEPKECYNQLNDAREKQSKTVFIVALVVGVLTVVLSFFLKKEEVGAGLLGGSILLILYGTIRYWEFANNVIKFVLLGVALAVLIWIGYKKLK